MSDLTPLFRPERTWFLTVTLADEDSALLTRHVGELADSARDFEHLHPFETIATVILPNHMHAIWVLPEDDNDFRRRVEYLQASFARRMVEGGHVAEKEADRIWHPRFWDYRIRDAIDMERHVGFMHGNPVKHGLVSHPDKWRYSTWHKFRADGFALWTSDSLRTSGEP
jgi:REP-associated tyrosine transposase